MKNNEKRELRWLAKNDYSFDMIRDIVDCCDATIIRYIKVFQTKKIAKTIYNRIHKGKDER